MRHLALLPLVAALLAAGSTAAAAQSTLIPVSLEVRGHAGLPVGDFAEAAGGGPDAGPGIGFGAGASVDVSRSLEIYGLYHYASLECGACGQLELDDRVLGTALEAGARLSVPGPVAWRPWISAGLLVGRLTMSSVEDEEISSDQGTGFGVGAGITIPLRDGLAVRPGLHYRSYPAEYTFPATDLPARSIDVTYLGIDVALAYHF